MAFRQYESNRIKGTISFLLAVILALIITIIVITRNPCDKKDNLISMETNNCDCDSVAMTKRALNMADSLQKENGLLSKSLEIKNFELKLAQDSLKRTTDCLSLINTSNKKDNYQDQNRNRTKYKVPRQVDPRTGLEYE